MVGWGMRGRVRRSSKSEILSQLSELEEWALDGVEVLFEDDGIWPASKTVKGYFIGPQGSPYANGLFSFTYTFPKDYPYSPPAFKILTNILHPAVISGKLCLDCFKDVRFTSICEVLLQLKEELMTPNFENCVIERALEHYQAGKFEQKAQKATRKYAM